MDPKKDFAVTLNPNRSSQVQVAASMTKDVAKDMATMLEQVPVAAPQWATKATALEGCRIAHKAGGNTKITLADAVVGTDSFARKSTVIRSPVPMTADDKVYAAWEKLLAERYPNDKELHRSVFVDTFEEAKQSVNATNKRKKEEEAATKLQAATAKRARTTDTAEAEAGGAPVPAVVQTTPPGADAAAAAGAPPPARRWLWWR